MSSSWEFQYHSSNLTLKSYLLQNVLIVAINPDLLFLIKKKYQHKLFYLYFFCRCPVGRLLGGKNDGGIYLLCFYLCEKWIFQKNLFESLLFSFQFCSAKFSTLFYKLNFTKTFVHSSTFMCFICWAPELVFLSGWIYYYLLILFNFIFQYQMGSPHYLRNTTMVG